MFQVASRYSNSNKTIPETRFRPIIWVRKIKSNIRGLNKISGKGLPVTVKLPNHTDQVHQTLARGRRNRFKGPKTIAKKSKTLV